MGLLGPRTAKYKAPPTRESFSAFRLPAFHFLSSVQVRKCCQTSLWDNIGWRHTRSTKLWSCFRRCSMNSSSYRPGIDINLLAEALECYEATKKNGDEEGKQSDDFGYILEQIHATINTLLLNPKALSQTSIETGEELTNEMQTAIGG